MVIWSYLWRTAAAGAVMGLAALASYFGGNLIGNTFLSGTWITDLLALFLRPAIFQIIILVGFWILRAVIFILGAFIAVTLFFPVPRRKNLELGAADEQRSGPVAFEGTPSGSLRSSPTCTVVLELDSTVDHVLWRRGSMGAKNSEQNVLPVTFEERDRQERNIRALRAASLDPRISDHGRHRMLGALLRRTSNAEKSNKD